MQGAVSVQLGMPQRLILVGEHFVAEHEHEVSLRGVTIHMRLLYYLVFHVLQVATLIITVQLCMVADRVTGY